MFIAEKFNDMMPTLYCEPKNTSVPVPKDPDPNVIMWPMCVEVMRCSGCCEQDLLACTPTQTQDAVRQVRLSHQMT